MKSGIWHTSSRLQWELHINLNIINKHWHSDTQTISLHLLDFCWELDKRNHSFIPLPRTVEFSLELAVSLDCKQESAGSVP